MSAQCRICGKSLEMPEGMAIILLCEEHRKSKLKL